MPNIVAGRFDEQIDADAALARLRSLGFEDDQATSFFVNPPGQHAQFLLGGDRAVSPGAATAGTGAAAGAAVGGAVGLGVGLAASPFIGPAAAPAAAGVGAYVGALAGALGKMEDAPADASPAVETAEVRHAGVMVAVHAPTPEQRAIVVRALEACGAKNVETADGQWRDGKWIDFDPLAPPSAETTPVGEEKRPETGRSEGED